MISVVALGANLLFLVGLLSMLQATLTLPGGGTQAPGRVVLGQVLPRNPKTPFDVVNKLMTKREISNMIDTVYRHCGQKETVIFCDRIMALGFHNAFKAGISFGKDDMVVPDSKSKIIEKTDELVDATAAAIEAVKKYFNSKTTMLLRQ